VGDLATPGAASVGTRDGGPLDELVAAVTFLTRVPVASRGARRSRTGAAAFGLVGTALGLAAAVPLLVAGGAHPLPAAIISVGILALLDGGLHLDGLADTFDALAAPGGVAERARTDPRAGTAGVVAIVVVVGLQAAALAELAGRSGLIAGITLIAAMTVSRAAAPAWAVTVGRRVAPPDGLGAWFAEATSIGAASVAIVSAIVVTLVGVELAGPVVAVAVGAGTVVSVLIGAVVVRLRRQLDGDGYGTLIETSAVAVLLAATFLASGTVG
jgi:adenosylcobinamide-GDP ribazoletransferase